MILCKSIFRAAKESHVIDEDPTKMCIRDRLLDDKKKAYGEYRRSREDMRELLTAKANVDRILNIEAEHDAEKEKDHGQR